MHFGGFNSQKSQHHFLRQLTMTKTSRGSPDCSNFRGTLHPTSFSKNVWNNTPTEKLFHGGNREPERAKWRQSAELPRILPHTGFFLCCFVISAALWLHRTESAINFTKFCNRWMACLRWGLIKQNLQNTIYLSVLLCHCPLLNPMQSVSFASFAELHLHYRCPLQTLLRSIIILSKLKILFHIF